MTHRPVFVLFSHPIVWIMQRRNPELIKIHLCFQATNDTRQIRKGRALIWEGNRHLRENFLIIERAQDGGSDVKRETCRGAGGEWYRRNVAENFHIQNKDRLRFYDKHWLVCNQIVRLSSEKPDVFDQSVLHETNLSHCNWNNKHRGWMSPPKCVISIDYT